jgi:hypothetical protein
MCVKTLEKTLFVAGLPDFSRFNKGTKMEKNKYLMTTNMPTLQDVHTTFQTFPRTSKRYKNLDVWQP